jgi:hypothetical protein
VLGLLRSAFGAHRRIDSSTVACFLDMYLEDKDYLYLGSRLRCINLCGFSSP